MKLSESFTEKDVDLLYLYPDGISHRPGAQNKRKPIPAGWMMNHKNVVSAENKTKQKLDEANKHIGELSNKKAKYQPNFSIDTQLDNTNGVYKKDDVNDKEAPNQIEGWRSNVYLPEGWLCKKNYEGKNIRIMSLNGTKLSSYREAAVYMHVNTLYSTTDIERLYLYPDGVKRGKVMLTKKSARMERENGQHLGIRSEIPRIKLIKSKNGTIKRITNTMEKSLWAKLK